MIAPISNDEVANQPEAAAGSRRSFCAEWKSCSGDGAPTGASDILSRAASRALAHVSFSMVATASERKRLRTI